MDIKDAINVGSTERIVSILGGAVLGLYGLGRIRLSGVALAALGGALIYRGVTGHCNVYESLGVDGSYVKTDPITPSTIPSCQVS